MIAAEDHLFLLRRRVLFAARADLTEGLLATDDRCAVRFLHMDGIEVIRLSEILRRTIILLGSARYLFSVDVPLIADELTGAVIHEEHIIPFGTQY